MCYLRWLVIVCLLCVPRLTSQVFAARPNVLFISIDDLNDWIGCLGGHPQARTPNIDRLAAAGILFTNAHCAAPACNPSRAAVFSGKMPSTTGIWSNDSSRLLHEDSSFTLIPTAFKKAGYRTYGTGKLMHAKSANAALFDRHFNVEQRWSPLTGDAVRYTEQELATKGSAHPTHVVKLPGGPEIVLPLNRMPSDRNPRDAKGESFDWGPMAVADTEMGDTQITDWAIEQLQVTSNQPFFLGVGYYRPHIPLWVPASYFVRFENQKTLLPLVRDDDLDDLSKVARKWAIEPVTAGRHRTVLEYRQWEAAVTAYLACVSFVDHQLGRLVTALEASDHADNTLIVLWSDHGWHLGEKRHWGKWTGWERSTRIPLIVVPPNNKSSQFPQRGARCPAPVSLLDLYPTLMECCAITGPPGLEGESLVPLLKAPDQPTQRTIVTTFDRGNVSLRNDRWRYIRYADGSEELYDHRTDPNEWNNKARDAQHAATITRFRKRVPAR